MKGKWEVLEIFPNQAVLGSNIRSRNHQHIDRLAESMLEAGQLQECVGDIKNGVVRIWAGQHRFWAAEKINDSGVPFKLRVRVFSSPLPPDEVLAIQISENLHEAMTPAEEAEAIERLWAMYSAVFAEKKSVADLARRIGRGDTKVRDALKFVGLDPRVRKLAEERALLYSVAVEIARLPAEKQFGTSVKIVLYNLGRAQALRLINTYLEEQRFPGLFSEQQQAALERQNHVLAFRNAADRAAKDAAGYFERVLYLLKLLEEDEALKVTNVIKDILASLVRSSSKFIEILDEKEAELAVKIREAANLPN